jgi:hypothetical protein
VRLVELVLDLGLGVVGRVVEVPPVEGQRARARDPVLDQAHLMLMVAG